MYQPVKSVSEFSRLEEARAGGTAAMAAEALPCATTSGAFAKTAGPLATEREVGLAFLVVLIYGPGLPGGLIIYHGHLIISLTGHL